MCSALDPDSVPLPEVIPLWESFDAMERLVAGAKCRLARRVEESRSWADKGARSPAEHLGAISGTTTGRARAALEASKASIWAPTSGVFLDEGADPAAPVPATPAPAGRADPEDEAAAPARTPARSRRPDTKVIVLISYEALKRGLAEADEICEIAGTGPVSVATVNSLMGDAFGAAIVTNGVDVFTVAHLGRSATAHQRSALEARGYHCEVPGCGSTTALQIDHIEDWHKTFRTELDQLCWLCGGHHDDKAHRGWRLEGPPGNRRWLPPGEAGAQRDAPGPDPPTPACGEPPALFGDPSAA